MARLQLRGIRRTFGEDPPINALRDIDLVIEQGEYLAIQGPSGSGKSTLLNQLALVDTPTDGAYTIDDELASAINEGQRARLRSDTFGFIFQRFHLMLHRTARENVEVGLLYRGVDRKTRRRLADSALEEVGLADRAHVAARKLSGGEQQRVAIARATLGAAPVLVADEPTGNLDTETGSTIVGQLEALNARGTTVVVVTHDAEVAARARRQVRMRDGLIIADVTRSEPPADGVQSDGDPPKADAAERGEASTLRASDLLRESWHALQGRLGRTLLLVGGIAVASGLIVTTLSLSQTTSDQVSSSFDLQRNREVTVTVPTLTEGRGDAATAVTGVPDDVETRLSQLAGLTGSGVAEAHDSVGVVVPGLTPRTEEVLVGISPGLLSATGSVTEWASGHDHALSGNEVVVGALAAEQLQLGPLSIDPVVRLKGDTYRVVGIVRSSSRAPELLASVLAERTVAADVTQLTGSTVFITTVGGAARQVARQAPLAIDPVRADQFETKAPPDPSTLRSSVQSDVRSALLALTIIATLASVLGVANAMLLSVIERTGEFGLRRAIGARPIHVLGQTSTEAALAGLLGGLLGLLGAFAVILAVTLVNRWQPVLDLRVVPIALIGGVIVGMVGGLPASFRASRIQPADALRV